MIGSLYLPGRSPLHRLPAGLKAAALPVFGTVLFLVERIVPLAAALALVIALHALARVPPRLVLRQLRPAAGILLVLFLSQLWLADLSEATVLVLRFVVLILAAALVTLTTRSADLVAALERALRPLGMLGADPRKFGLAIALTLRFIPVLAVVAEEVREAQRARGRDRSILALAVPLIVRTLKLADEVAEAIDARGG
ncbi:energy-coupling factor transporter transmembrane component T family protein [Mangrovibrevibacter kandeliae]|uniref:energy-coupling factor transporter transmembrane component T family protein n=1 Tax=Mangrovibrevibacter kandeliae TaxID=2968473 RepID=UPI002117D270|nr:energy-coupling factor transporter transmembrane protein EcfT [Aurantimonas sp. CSK15Z-1]MCQ8781173.1 energy-coupling factor transporter transmembrane protein EcfT [Aurantimonas sp. CSK15Z-1]